MKSRVTCRARVTEYLAVLMLMALVIGLWGCSWQTKKSAGISPQASTKVKNPPADAATQARQQKLEALCEQGQQQFSAKQYQAAIATENQVLQDDPNFYQAYNVRGIALCYSGNFTEGMTNIDKALAINPGFSSSRFNKALAYELYGHYDTALVWYNKTLEVDKQSTWSYYGMASIYGRWGNVANTVKYLQQAININPVVKSYARGEKDFNNVRNSTEFQQLIQ